MRKRRKKSREGGREGGREEEREGGRERGRGRREREIRERKKRDFHSQKLTCISNLFLAPDSQSKQSLPKYHRHVYSGIPAVWKFDQTGIYVFRSAYTQQTLVL